MFHDLCCVLLLETSQNMLHITPAWETLDPAFGGGPDAPAFRGWSRIWENSAAAAAKSLQSWPTLCNPIDGSTPGSPVPGILQARTLEWVAISFSNAWEWRVKVKSLSRVRLLATPLTAAHQAPPSMGFSRQEHWSGAPLPSPIYGSIHIQWAYIPWNGL